MPDEVGVTGPWPGQRRVAAELGQLVGINRIGRHHRLPFRPLGVADPDRDRSALGAAVPNAAEKLHLVGLELHPGTPAVTEPATSQFSHYVVRGDLDTCDHPFQDGDQGRAV